MAFTQPPASNGVCPFVDNDTVCMAVQNKLAGIRAGFQPNDFQSTADTQYITATYNRTVAGTQIDATNGNYPIINGDTAEHCLSLYDANQAQSQGM